MVEIKKLNFNLILRLRHALTTKIKEKIMTLTKVETRPGYYRGKTPAAICRDPHIGHTYVRLLAECANAYKTRCELYPGKNHVMPNQLYALENGGFLERYTKPEWKDYDIWPKTWWRTTPKGLQVVARAALAMIHDR